ncbi:hypothetical protein QTP88_009453 [Uroleucon formosanum]
MRKNSEREKFHRQRRSLIDSPRACKLATLALARTCPISDGSGGGGVAKLSGPFSFAPTGYDSPGPPTPPATIHQHHHHCHSHSRRQSVSCRSYTTLFVPHPACLKPP